MLAHILLGDLRGSPGFLPQIIQGSALRGRVVKTSRAGGDKMTARCPTFESGRSSRPRSQRFLLTSRQASDYTQALALMGGFKADFILADKGYDGDYSIEGVASFKAQAVIPQNSTVRHRASMTTIFVKSAISLRGF